MDLNELPYMEDGEQWVHILRMANAKGTQSIDPDTIEFFASFAQKLLDAREATQGAPRKERNEALLAALDSLDVRDSSRGRPSVDDLPLHELVKRKEYKYAQAVAKELLSRPWLTDHAACDAVAAIMEREVSMIVKAWRSLKDHEAVLSGTERLYIHTRRVSSHKHLG